MSVARRKSLGIKASGAQALIVYAIGPAFRNGVARRGRRRSRHADVDDDGANLIYGLMKQLGPLLPKELYFTGPPGVAYDSIPNGALKDAVRTFVTSTRGAGLHPDIALLAAWDPAVMTVAALKKLGLNATSAQIEDYIQNLHGWAGAYGIYDFRDGSQRGLAESNGIVVRWDPAKDYWVGVSKLKRRRSAAKRGAQDALSFPFGSPRGRRVHARATSTVDPRRHRCVRQDGRRRTSTYGNGRNRRSCRRSVGRRRRDSGPREDLSAAKEAKS